MTQQTPTQERAQRILDAIPDAVWSSLLIKARAEFVMQTADQAIIVDDEVWEHIVAVVVETLVAEEVIPS